MGQAFLPIRPILQDTSSEHVLQNLINPLCLWVVRGAVIQSCPYGLVETLLELGHVLRAMIRHYASRGSVEFENVLDVQIC